jgi:putative transposase
MFKITLKALAVALRSRRQLVLENIALRHQLEVLQRNAKRPRLRPSDRALWALLSRFLPDWRLHLSIVQPDTVIRWHPGPVGGSTGAGEAILDEVDRRCQLKSDP